MLNSCLRPLRDARTHGAGSPAVSAPAAVAALAEALGVLLLVALCLLLPTTGAAQLLPVPAASTAVAAAAVARAGARRVDAVEAELVADVARAAPGEPFRLGLRLKHDPHWHTYWRNPGDSGLPTRFEPQGPEGAAYGDISWPAPSRLAIGDLANYGYEGEVILSRQVTLPSGFQAKSARFEVQAQWLVCKDVCIPGEAALALELPVGEPAAAASGAMVALFEANARRVPDAAAEIVTHWWQQGDRAFLVLPPGQRAGRAEFFPYFEGRIRPAAAQMLVEARIEDAARTRSVEGSQARSSGVAQTEALGAAGAAGAAVDMPPGVARLALQLELVPEAGRLEPPAAQSGATVQRPAIELPQPAAGLLMLDGQPVQVALRPLAVEPVAGRVLSTAQPRVSASPGSAGGLDRLRSAAPSAIPPAASDSVARPFPARALGAPSGTLLIALAGALLGGLLLNLMPCVFPVIGLKVLSFSEAASGETRLARVHALAFSAGVLLSFIALGLIMLALRAAGEAAGWGFQMQSPLFVGAMALLFVLIALNLFGVFETGIALTRLNLPGADGAGQGVGGGSGVATEDARHGQKPPPAGGGALSNSFLTGVIAVLVATPCTAPFMGSAVGYTISSPAADTLLVFAALGLGMAAPYLVLGSAPELLRRLPRPGPWLLLFKQVLAFPMLATAAWLTWVLTLQAGADGLLRLLMSAVLIAFAAWLYGRAQAARFSGQSRPGLGGMGGMAAAGLAGLLSVWQLGQIATSVTPGQAAGTVGMSQERRPDTGGRSLGASDAEAASVSGSEIRSPGSVAQDRVASSAWQPWSPQGVSQALAQGRPVMVVFTAAWCISCQVNKKMVLDREVVRDAFDANGVALLSADWTSRDPAITAELARFGRNGVPLYLVYHPSDQLPLLLPELLTVDIVLAALAAGPQTRSSAAGR